MTNLLPISCSGGNSPLQRTFLTTSAVPRALSASPGFGDNCQAIRVPCLGRSLEAPSPPHQPSSGAVPSLLLPPALSSRSRGSSLGISFQVITQLAPLADLSPPPPAAASPTTRLLPRTHPPQPRVPLPDFCPPPACPACWGAKHNTNLWKAKERKEKPFPLALPLPSAPYSMPGTEVGTFQGQS